MPELHKKNIRAESGRHYRQWAVAVWAPSESSWWSRVLKSDNFYLLKDAFSLLLAGGFTAIRAKSASRISFSGLKIMFY